MKLKPFFILNLTNVDFIFHYLDENHYSVGYGEEPGYSNEYVKKTVMDDLYQACDIKVDKNSPKERFLEYHISYIQLDEERKRYVISGQWVTDKKSIKTLIDINDLTKFLPNPTDFLKSKLIED